jgi:hypothetical protein
MPDYDAILIPGGGVRAGGALPAWVTPRLDRALELAGTAFLVPLSAGTPHRAPPLDDRGFPWTEARAAGRYLAERGADPARILLEEASYDTIGNAYFSRVIHAMPRCFRRVLVITSEFHMARTEAAFRWVYGLDGATCTVDFEAVPDVGIDEATLAARLEKERASLATLEALRAEIRTLAEFHLWFFTQHKAYCCGSKRTGGAERLLY